MWNGSCSAASPAPACAAPACRCSSTGRTADGVAKRPSYYYSSKFARPAQIIWSGIPPAKAQRRQGYGERTKTLINDFHPQSPNFAPFASLREILRVSAAALPAGNLWINGFNGLNPSNRMSRQAANFYLFAFGGRTSSRLISRRPSARAVVVAGRSFFTFGAAQTAAHVIGIETQ